LSPNSIRDRSAKETEKVTDGELILSLCREKGFRIEASNEDELILKFRESYGDHGSLIANAAQGDPKALRRLRWIFRSKVIPNTNYSTKRRYRTK
jgi:hypothetical protein